MQKKLTALSEKTMDINQFLVDQAGIKPVEAGLADADKEIVTYHDPCHLKNPWAWRSNPGRSFGPPAIGWQR